MNPGGVCYDFFTLQGYSGGKCSVGVENPSEVNFMDSDVGIGFALQSGLVSVCLYESQVQGAGRCVDFLFFFLCRWLGLGNRGKGRERWEGSVESSQGDLETELQLSQ